MGLFDSLFSSKPAEDAAAAKKTGLQAGFDQATPYFQQGTNAAAGYTNTGLANAASASGTGINNAAGYLGQGFTDASALTGQGFDTAKAYGTAALAPWQSIYGDAKAGAGAYGDAVGANGADGYARAKTNFQTDPGYGFQMDQGLQALDRTAAARGGLAGGGLTGDTLKFSQGLADQSYGNYVNRLSPYLGQENTAASAMGGINTGLGSTGNSDFATLAGLKANQAGTLAGASTTAGSQLAGLNGSLFGQLGQTANANDVNTGNLANATQTGIGNANADAALAPYQASQNFWGALMGGANLATKAFTGGGAKAPTSSINYGGQLWPAYT